MSVNSLKLNADKTELLWAGSKYSQPSLGSKDLPLETDSDFGQRSFAVFGPATWNSLHPSLCAPELSLNTFKRLLKTRLFQHA